MKRADELFFRVSLVIVAVALVVVLTKVGAWLSYRVLYEERVEATVREVLDEREAGDE